MLGRPESASAPIWGGARPRSVLRGRMGLTWRSRISTDRVGHTVVAEGGPVQGTRVNVEMHVGPRRSARIPEGKRPAALIMDPRCPILV